MTAPADWYPDPDGSGGIRYWDGSAWTEHRSPSPPPAQAWPYQNASPSQTYRPAGGLGMASSALAAAVALLQIVVAITAFPAMDRMRESVALNGTTDAFYTTYDVVVLFQYVLLLGAYIVTCLWLWRVRVNAEVLEPHWAHARARGWVWGGWVCPFVAWWFPFQIVRDIRGATASNKYAIALVGWWWTGMLILSISTSITGQISTSPGAYGALGVFEVIGATGAVLAAPLWFGIVRKIGKDQAAAESGQQERAAWA